MWQRKTFSLVICPSSGVNLSRAFILSAFYYSVSIPPLVMKAKGIFAPSKLLVITRLRALSAPSITSIATPPVPVPLIMTPSISIKIAGSFIESSEESLYSSTALVLFFFIFFEISSFAVLSFCKNLFPSCLTMESI